MRLDSFSASTAENLEFLDTPICIHIHMVTMHEYKTLMMVRTHCDCMTKYGSTQVSFVQNVTQVRFFSSRACEFLNWETFC